MTIIDIGILPDVVDGLDALNAGDMGRFDSAMDALHAVRIGGTDPWEEAATATCLAVSFLLGRAQYDPRTLVRPILTQASHVHVDQEFLVQLLEGYARRDMDFVTDFELLVLHNMVVLAWLHSHGQSLHALTSAVGEQVHVFSRTSST